MEAGADEVVRGEDLGELGARVRALLRIKSGWDELYAGEPEADGALERGTS